MINEYKKLIKEFKKILDGKDPEGIHIFRDAIYEDFIDDISNNKIKTKKEIEVIAKLLKKELVDKDLKLWYA
jgi:hypothetical protein